GREIQLQAADMNGRPPRQLHFLHVWTVPGGHVQVMRVGNVGRDDVHRLGLLAGEPVAALADVHLRVRDSPGDRGWLRVVRGLRERGTGEDRSGERERKNNRAERHDLSSMGSTSVVRKKNATRLSSAASGGRASAFTTRNA